MTDAVEQQVLPKYIQKNLLRLVRRGSERKLSDRAQDSALIPQRRSIKLIKKCNDFGAGGVSVAIGELADGLRVDLDKVPKKYAGLDGTEIAISES